MLPLEGAMNRWTFVRRVKIMTYGLIGHVVIILLVLFALRRC